MRLSNIERLFPPLDLSRAAIWFSTDLITIDRLYFHVGLQIGPEIGELAIGM